MEPVLPFALTLGARGDGTRARDLHRQLRNAILDGRLTPGYQLPSTRRVAAALGIARNTVARAYDLLIAESYVVPRDRAKPVVAGLRPQRRSRIPRSRRSRLTRRIAPPRLPPGVRTDPRRGLPESSFRLGIPDYRYFPHDTWRRLTARALRAFARQSFSYSPAEGIPALRDAIASHVAFTRAVACSADDIVVTSGAQQAFDLLARLFVSSERTTVAVEEPGYPPLRAAFLAAGATVIPVPVDDEGLRVDKLPGNVRVVSVTPSHQSPTGVVLSMRRRTALLEFAVDTGAVILEDDYDGEFRFGGRPLDALQTLDRDDLVFHVGTFSKSLFPALRKGFIVAPAWARESIVTLKQCVDSHCDLVSQSVLADFMREGHLARHVRRMRPLYAARRKALLDGLSELGEWLEPVPSEAGLHLAARIRRPAMAQALIAAIRQFLPGAQSFAEYAMKPVRTPGVTFGYGTIDAADIRPAIARLRRWLA